MTNPLFDPHTQQMIREARRILAQNRPAIRHYQQLVATHGPAIREAKRTIEMHGPAIREAKRTVAVHGPTIRDALGMFSPRPPSTTRRDEDPPGWVFEGDAGLSMAWPEENQ
ncbi:MAG: hypothetical protein F4152_03600 [Dehalococcoidia bacterium]|nr:hypothetical protein [Acidobacteriota bacterium]MYH67657.1 hypothetical protein [Dehalococcoidia bacterium]